MNLQAIKPDNYLIIGIVGAIAFNFILPIKRIIPDPYTFIGVLIAFAGYLLARKANAKLIKNKTTIFAFDQPTVLINTGPFKHSRNPIYLGMFLILLGFAGFLGSLSPFIFPIIFFYIVNRYIIPDEEKRLEVLFGEKYLYYKKIARRWF